MEFEFNPYDHRLHEDPYPIYRELRENYPLYYNERHHFWVLSRFDDVRAAVLDPETFSSAHGITIPMSEDGIAIPNLSVNPMPMVITMDPPRHNQLRNLVNRAFTSRRIMALEGDIRQVATELIDDFIESGESEISHDFAGPYPTTVICEMLGCDRRHRRVFKQCADELITNTSSTGFMAEGAGREIIDILVEAIADRRKHPTDDLISILLDASPDGGAMSEQELIGFVFLLLVAGTETTTNLITNAMLLMDRFPDARREMVDDPSKIPAAVEEFLRFDSPVQGLARTLTRPAEIHGRTIPEGDRVLVLFGSANRDEKYFDRPEEFDISRNPNNHLAFGFGIHFCLGASLARLEARVAFEELLGRIPEYEVTCDKIERLHSGPIRGVTQLPIRFQRN